MPFFERPLLVGGSSASATNNLSLLVYPAKKVPSVMELGILVKEKVKRRTTTIGILPQEKVTRRDSGCGEFTPTGTLLKLTKNQITVDPVEIKLQECADDYTETVLEAALKDGHTEDNNLEGTVIQTIVEKALTEGLGSLSASEAGQLDMALEPVLMQQVSGVVYLDGYRMWLLGDRTLSDPNYNQTDGIRKKLLTAAPPEFAEADAADEDTKAPTKEDLQARYKQLYGKDAPKKHSVEKLTTDNHTKEGENALTEARTAYEAAHGEAPDQRLGVEKLGELTTAKLAEGTAANA